MMKNKCHYFKIKHWPAQLKPYQSSKLKKLAWLMALILLVGSWGELLTQNPRPARAVTQMVLFWDNANGSVPTDWTQDTSYNNFMLRGNSTAGGTGGSDADHSHTVTNVTVDNASTGTATRSNKGGTNVTPATHTHNIISSSTGTAGSVPYYRGLIVITCDSGVPAVLPAKAIALFDTTGTFGVSGFTRYADQDGAFLRGAATAGGTGGSNVLHGHSNVTFTTDVSTTSQDAYAGSGATVATNTHTHTFSGGTTNTDGDIRPPYVDIVLATVDSANTPIPTGMIAMFNGSPDGTWSVLSNGGGDFNQHYMSGAATYTAGLGYATHTHAKTGGYTTSSWTAATNVTTGAPSRDAATSHAHTVLVPTFSDVANAPAYKDVIVAKKLANLGVTAPGDITLTTGNPGDTEETTFDISSKVIVTDGGSGWSLTVAMQTTLTSGGYTIPDANVKIHKDGLVGGGDTYTIWSGTITNITETDAIESLDASPTVGIRSSGTGGDTSEVRPTIQVVIPVGQHPADYTGSIRFTVA